MKHTRKRIFSLIFVPDQDQEPRSISMSYARGKLIVGILVFLTLHMIVGAVGYWRIFKLESIKSTLETENIELKTENQKIEEIAREFYQIRMTDEKIRKAFGSSLGFDDSGPEALENLEIESDGTSFAQARQPVDLSGMISQNAQTQNNLYFLKADESHFYNPEHLPTLLPVEGYLTTHFQKGGWFAGRSHHGIDIAARRGATIRAAGSGVVLLSGWSQGFGNVVVISHGNGMASYYAHAMRLLVEQGDPISKGQPIALLGSSGISSAPHLHFEIWKEGQPIDPETFIYALQQN